MPSSMNGSDDRAADKERSLSNAVVHLIDPELSFALGPEPDRHLDLERDLGSFRKANDLAVSHIKQSLPPFEGSVELHSVPGLSGNPDVAVIRYLQKNSEFHDAVMIWVHGGGFIAGTADDPVVHRFAPLMQVISVEYRLAPEHRAPAAVHDVVAVVQWVHDQASFLGIDQSRIVLAGASAGGGIAASAALSIRDRKGPQLLHQFLIYPMLDDQHNTTSGQFDLPRTTLDKGALASGVVDVC